MKTFFPDRQRIRTVPTAADHGPNAAYRVAIGSEEWDDGHVRVLKVQLEYDGQVQGRRSPSFPVEETRDGFPLCDDFDRVVEAAEALLQPLRWYMVCWDRPTNGKDIGAILTAAVHKLLGPIPRLKSLDLVQRPCFNVMLFEFQGDAERILKELELALKADGLEPNDCRLVVSKCWRRPELAGRGPR